MTGQHTGAPQILIVDDNRQVLGFLTKVLSMDGYRVLGTSSPERAVELLSKDDFNLLILDLEMPKLDGFDILKLTRSKRDRLKVIVISGYLDGALLLAARALGAADTIQKPVTADALLAKVHETVGAPTV